MSKWVYFFGAGKAEGTGEMKDLLGGKGAGLAEMTRVGLPVPAGFTITTEACDYYDKHGKKYPPELAKQVRANVARLERVKSLQMEGRTLSEIGRIVGGVEAEQGAAAPTAWWQHAVADDVVVWTRADMSPWRTRQVRAAIGELGRFLGKERKE